MTEIPNHQIIEAKETLERILGQTREAPVKLVYAAKKNLDKLSEESEYLEDFRMNLLREYAKTDEDGTIVQKTDEEGNPVGEAEFKSEEDLNQFQEELNEIWNETADIDVHSVNVDKVRDYSVPAEWGRTLDFMLEGFDTTTKSLRGSQVQANVNSIEEVLNVGADEKSKRIPIKFSAALFKTYEEIIECQAQIEQERFELLNEYAEKDEDGSIKTAPNTANAQFPDDETEDQFQKELSEIYNREFEVEGTTVEVDLLDDVELHPRHTIIFDWMLTE